MTDLNADSIGVNFNTILGAIYDTTQDLNYDGDKDDKVTIPNPIVGQYMVRVVAEPGDSGDHTLSVKLDGNEDTPMVTSAPSPGQDQADTFYYPVTSFLRGDPNTDGKKTFSDAIFLINYLFKGGPAPDPLLLGDLNCDDKVAVSDVVYLIYYLFKGGKIPCS